MFTEATFAAFMALALPQVRADMVKAPAVERYQPRGGYITDGSFGTMAFTRAETRMGSIHCTLSWDERGHLIGLFLKPNGVTKCMVHGTFDRENECFRFSGADVPNGYGCPFPEKLFCLEPL